MKTYEGSEEFLEFRYEEYLEGRYDSIPFFSSCLPFIYVLHRMYSKGELAKDQDSPGPSPRDQNQEFGKAVSEIGEEPQLGDLADPKEKEGDALREAMKKLQL